VILFVVGAQACVFDEIDNGQQGKLSALHLRLQLCDFAPTLSLGPRFPPQVTHVAQEITDNGKLLRVTHTTFWQVVPGVRSRRVAEIPQQLVYDIGIHVNVHRIPGLDNIFFRAVIVLLRYCCGSRASPVPTTKVVRQYCNTGPSSFANTNPNMPVFALSTQVLIQHHKPLEQVEVCDL